MVKLFRGWAFYKVLFLLVFFLALRLPVMLGGLTWLNPEIHLFAIGEQLYYGNFLYTQIWDDIPPLSAALAWGLYAAFGKSHLASQILAHLLVLIQALLYNQILNRRQVFLEVTWLPALLYITLASIYVDYFVLSEAMLATTFLLLVINYMFLQISEKRRYDGVFEIGVYTGVAMLFYLPSFWVMGVIVFFFLLYSDIRLQRYFLLIFSFLFTILIVFLFFYLFDAEYNFLINYLNTIILLNKIIYLSIWKIIVVFFVPFLFVGFNMLKSPQYRRYNNYQNRCQTAMFFWVFLIIPVLLLSNKLSATSLFIVLPALVFLLTHYLLMMRNALLAELVWVVVLSNAVFFTYSTLYQLPIDIKIPYLSQYRFYFFISGDELLSRTTPQEQALAGKKVWVLGEALGVYAYARPATPYFNSQFAQRHLAHIDQYSILIALYDNLRRDLPDVIIDQRTQIPALWKAMPALARLYRPMPKRKGWYERIGQP